MLPSGLTRRRGDMQIMIKNPEDRDLVVQILARNGYEIKQGKASKPGTKNMTVGTVVFWQEGPGDHE